MKKRIDWLWLMGVLLVAVAVHGQATKATLDHDVWGTWKTINHPQLSPDGQWLTYQIRPGQGNSTVIITNTSTAQSWQFPRASQVAMSYAGKAVIFRQSLDFELEKQQRRLKLKKSEVPSDTLVVFDLATQSTHRYPGLKSVTIPAKWDGWLSFQAVDTATAKANHAPLLVLKLDIWTIDTFHSVQSHVWCEKSPKLAMVIKNVAPPGEDGIYIQDLPQQTKLLVRKGPLEVKGLNWDKAGQRLAYLVSKDTASAKIKTWELNHWSSTTGNQVVSLDGQNLFVQNGLSVSEYTTPYFSDSGQRLYFGTALAILPEDTRLLPEEKVQVEVWNYQDALLYTQQEARESALKEKNFLAWVDLSTQESLPLGLPAREEVILSPGGDGRYALALDPHPYQALIGWEGAEFKDAYVIDMTSGQSVLLASRLENTPRISPLGQYVCWYQDADSTWYMHRLGAKQTSILVGPRTAPFYDETNDRPDHPSAAGLMGWSAHDQAVYLYDQYDIWVLDPLLIKPPRRITQGREHRWRYRYLSTDPDEKYIDDQKPIFASLYDDRDKSTGYARVDLKTGELVILRKGAYSYSPLIKARQSDSFLFTKADYQTFPDLWLTNQDFHLERRFSDANPQQKKFWWGKAELVHWTSLDGALLDGILIKPENFDPQKKYPLIINFYERSSHTLFDYRPLDPHRSQIVYPFYSSNGYLIFNPDIPYKTGYPGESAFNAIMSGVNYLLAQGFVDATRIGIQGHSWGGYQVAYLLTRTNLFRCAESGAPVVNMFSAYGGIRWQSGMSRMFQYEKDQSRIGGSIWQYPLRFIENSPVFSLDKISTPVLILHNDQDGAVPWYQGIEFFTALRRLNKPTWLLNYNGEPHWPVKWQNRVDFQKRMSQFFDHYLLNKPAPKWMTSGVPALEKGLTTGLELNK